MVNLWQYLISGRNCDRFSDVFFFFISKACRHCRSSDHHWRPRKSGRLRCSLHVFHWRYATQENIVQQRVDWFSKVLKSFSQRRLVASLATLVVISVSTFVINYLSPYGYKGANGRGTSEEFSFFNSVWFALACMLQQGSENQPRSLSGALEMLLVRIRNTVDVRKGNLLFNNGPSY